MERRMQPVDVISMCSTTGQIYPLRMQVEQENHERLQIRIDQIIAHHESCRIGLETQIFWCKATVWERPFEFELRYAIRSHSWFLVADGTLRQ